MTADAAPPATVDPAELAALYDWLSRFNLLANLRAMGAEVEEFPDGLSVSGPTQLHGALLNSHGDHRIAMAFAVAALLAKGETEISGADCVAISFPEFFPLLESLVRR